VVSSTGGVTDSHSDDHSGSNHCFTGAKLWLMWETLEGLKHGLEDVERCDVYSKAAFDMGEFLSMRSSSWLLITDDQTIFIPGHLTHKVITLDRYLGLGSFHAALPSFLDSLARCTLCPPLWANQRLEGDCSYLSLLTRRAIRRTRMLKTATRSERLRWGVPYLLERLRQLEANVDHQMSGAISCEGRAFQSFLLAAQQSNPESANII
jgi:hypothetical protein